MSSDAQLREFFWHVLPGCLEALRGQSGAAAQRSAGAIEAWINAVTAVPAADRDVALRVTLQALHPQLVQQLAVHMRQNKGVIDIGFAHDVGTELLRLAQEQAARGRS